MAKGRSLHGLSRDELWREAKRRCRLNEDDVRKAKEMGLNPRSLIKNIPAPTEHWKAPVNIWVREMYAKRQRKSAAKKARKAAPAQAASAGGVSGASSSQPPPSANTPASDHVGLALAKIRSDFEDFARAELEGLGEYREGSEDPFDDDMDDPEHLFGEAIGAFDDPFDYDSPPTKQEIIEENDVLARRQREFRLAAEYVAEAFAAFPAVEKVALIGSVAVWHECKDMDLAVWVTSLDNLTALRKARSKAVKRLLEERRIGVADHQVEVFLLEPWTDRYLGRLCQFAVCPKQKPECLVPGCGESPFLRQHEDFVFRPRSLRPDRSERLFERAATGFETTDDVIPF